MEYLNSSKESYVYCVEASKVVSLKNVENEHKKQ